MTSEEHTMVITFVLSAKSNNFRAPLSYKTPIYLFAARLLGLFVEHSIQRWEIITILFVKTNDRGRFYN